MTHPPSTQPRRRQASRRKVRRAAPTTSSGASTAAISPRSAIRRSTRSTATTSAKLTVAWRFATGKFGPRPEQRNEATPLMIDGVLYTTVGRHAQRRRDRSGDGRDAVDVASRSTARSASRRAPRKTSGRGLAYWTDGQGNERLFVVTPGFHLVALDPETGRPMPGFGENGVVDLMLGVRGEVNETTSIGNQLTRARDRRRRRRRSGARRRDAAAVESEPEGRRARLRRAHGQAALDVPHDSGARRGRLRDVARRLGRVHGQRGRLGGDGGGSGARVMCICPSRLRSAIIYGGDRPGNNLYGNSLVCARCEDRQDASGTTSSSITTSGTGTTRRAPMLDGPRRRRATDQGRRADHEAGLGVHVRSRHGRAGLADRGAARADVATCPANGLRRRSRSRRSRRRSIGKGLIEDDLIDFTPALRAEAIEGTKVFPPGTDLHAALAWRTRTTARSGTLMLPHSPAVRTGKAARSIPRRTCSTSARSRIRSSRRWTRRPKAPNARTSRAAARRCRWLQGLPLVKPPWGTNHGDRHEHGRAPLADPNGPTPKEIAEHPALEGLDIPPTGRATRPVTLVTKTLLFTAEGWGGGPVLHAHDKATGEVLAEIPLPGAVGGWPMTYAIEGKPVHRDAGGRRTRRRARRAGTAAVSWGVKARCLTRCLTPCLTPEPNSSRVKKKRATS